VLEILADEPFDAFDLSDALAAWSGGGSVFVRTLATGRTIQIAARLVRDLHVEGHRVMWLSTKGNDLYVFDARTGNQRRMTTDSGPGAFLVDVCGNVVSCWAMGHEQGSPRGAYFFDLTSGSMHGLPGADSVDGLPKTDGQAIVWAQLSESRKHGILFHYDLRTQRTTRLMEGDGLVQRPAIRRGLAAWRYRPAGSHAAAVLVFDGNQVVTLPDATFDDLGPVTDGSIIAWTGGEVDAGGGRQPSKVYVAFAPQVVIDRLAAVNAALEIPLARNQPSPVAANETNKPLSPSDESGGPPSGSSPSGSSIFDTGTEEPTNSGGATPATTPTSGPSSTVAQSAPNGRGHSAANPGTETKLEVVNVRNQFTIQTIPTGVTVHRATATWEVTEVGRVDTDADNLRMAFPYVVWSSVGRVRIYNLESGTRTTIADARLFPLSDTNISGGSVGFRDREGIYLFQLSTGDIIRVAENTAAYYKMANGVLGFISRGDVFVYDLETGTLTQASFDGIAKTGVEIGNSHISWICKDAPMGSVGSYDFKSKKGTDLTDGMSGASSLDAAGDLVVSWNGDAATAAVHDFRTGVTEQLPTGGLRIAFQPHTDGKRIVWMASTRNKDDFVVFNFDSRTRRLTRLSEGMTCKSSPAISPDLVAWREFERDDVSMRIRWTLGVYDGLRVLRLDHATVSGVAPVVSGGAVLWWGSSVRTDRTSGVKSLWISMAPRASNSATGAAAD
jgi:hypothetical protein